MTIEIPIEYKRLFDNDWREAAGYEGLYWVSRDGRVKGVDNLKKPTVTNKGYFTLDLYKDNKRKKALVHRLVAQAFVPNPHNYPNVCHKDDNPQNNAADNLFWGTQKMNIADMMSKNRHGYKAHIGKDNGTAKLTDAQVYWIREQVNVGKTCAEIARALKVDRTTVSLVKRGLTWQHLK